MGAANAKAAESDDKDFVIFQIEQNVHWRLVSLRRSIGYNSQKLRSSLDNMISLILLFQARCEYRSYNRILAQG